MPAGSKVLKERVADVRFPNYFGKFGWKAVGTRTDEIKGRATRTVFYEKDGRRIAYTVVSGAALDEPDAADRATVEGAGSCARCAPRAATSSPGAAAATPASSPLSTRVPRDELSSSPAWKGMGEVAF